MLRPSPFDAIDRIGRSTLGPLIATFLLCGSARAEGPPGNVLLRVADAEPVLTPIDDAKAVVPKAVVPKAVPIPAHVDRSADAAPGSSVRRDLPARAPGRWSPRVASVPAADADEAPATAPQARRIARPDGDAGPSMIGLERSDAAGDSAAWDEWQPRGRDGARRRESQPSGTSESDLSELERDRPRRAVAPPAERETAERVHETAEAANAADMADGTETVDRAVEDPANNEPPGPLPPLDPDLQLWSDLAGELPLEEPQEEPSAAPSRRRVADLYAPRADASEPHEPAPRDEPEIAEAPDEIADAPRAEGPPAPQRVDGDGPDAGGPDGDDGDRPRELRRDVAALETSLVSSLRHYYRQYENMGQRTPWGTFHAMLPFGVDARVTHGRRTYNAIAWMCGNNPSRGQRLLTVRGRRIAARSGVGLQGHPAQFLAMLAQAKVPIDYPLHADRRKFSVADLVESEQLACRPGTELTFTLIALSHYLSTEDTWRASNGERWDFSRLIEEELKQPVVGAACGGTHRLMALSYALQQRRAEGLPIEGQWRRAEIYIDDFIEYAWSLQNPDGSMSTDWFEGRADNGDLDRKFQTTGHILEWLVFVAEPEQLQDDRVVRAVRFLLTAVSRYPNKDWAVGPKGHALRALSQYHAEVFGGPRPWAGKSVASGPTSPRR